MCLSLSLLQAQETTNEVQELKRQLKEAQDILQKAVEQHRQTIEALSRKLEALQHPQAAVTNQRPELPPSLTPAPSAPPAVESRGWRPSDPLRLGSGAAYLDLGLVGTFAAGGSTASDIEGGVESGGHDPYQRGFNIQGIELNVVGAVDPYFRGNVNLVYSLDAAGESYFELEEGWMETTSLPGNLQVRAGQIFTDFGRHNPTHLHTWSFVDQPLVNGRLLGPDGLRNLGARLAWLMPTPFYSELSLGVQNSQGETVTSFRSSGHTHGGGEDDGLPFAYRDLENDRGLQTVGDLLFSPRYAVSFDLSPEHVLLLGGSAALGPNSSGGDGAGDTTTRIVGVDLTWKWKSPRHHGGFPFVAWQTEAMLRQYDAGLFDWAGEAAAGATPVLDVGTGLPAVLPGEKLTDYGLYSQLLYGFRRGWVAGMRGDFVTSDPAAYERMNLTYDGEALGRDPQRAQRWRLSPSLTWYPSEYSKIRLQYNYDNRLGLGQDHSVWLQWEFLLGAHAAHKF